jgi:polyhydroxyalkanoate synthase
VSDPQQWLAAARTEQGSWWPDFAAWLGERCGPTTAAPQQLGGGGLRPLTAAPGTYVFEK